MSCPLTEYLRCLRPDGELTAEAYEEAREHLRRLLYRELTRRGLWLAPPRYLGIVGERWPGDTLEDLVSECYVAIFIHRLKYLEAALCAEQCVDGLIKSCVRHFVHDRQRHNDPIGYKLYKLVTLSLERLAQRGLLQWAPAGKISNRTVCAFGEIPQKVEATDLQEAIHRLNEDLWPELIVAQGAGRSGLEPRLDHHIAGLKQRAHAFMFRDLIEPLKRDTRTRWAEAVGTELANWAIPDASHDVLHLFDLQDCVRRRIEEEEIDDRLNLYRLWSFLFNYAIGINPSPVAAKAEKSDSPPSALGLEKALGLSRYRITGLKETLAEMIDACRAAVSENGGVSLGPKGPTRMDTQKDLRAETLRAVAEWAAERSEITSSSRPPAPGDLFALPGDGDLLLSWLAVELRDDGKVLVIPVDTSPDAGSRDVQLRAPVGSPSTVRCGVEARVELETIHSGQRLETLPAEPFARVLDLRKAMANGSVTVTPWQQDIDEDAEYREHLAELAARCSQLEGAERKVDPSSPSGGTVPFARPRASRRTLALAAMLILGLGSLVLWQRDRISKLEDHLEPAPYANLPFIWLTAEEPVRGPEDTLDIPIDARRQAFVLEISTPEYYPRYRVELAGKEPLQPVWSSDALVKTGSEISFDIPPSMLSTGEHEIKIYGLRESADPVLLETYSLWIRLLDRPASP